MTYFAKVVDGVIEKINVELPITIDGVFIPNGAENVEEFNLYPIVGDEPQYDSSKQIINGIGYHFTGSVVERVYSVVDIDIDTLRKKLMSDIDAEVQRKIRERYTLEDEQYFARIGVGVALGMYEFQNNEREELIQFGNYVESVRQWGREQRALIGL